MTSDDKKIWRQERPNFCPHLECQFIFRVMDAMCGGTLPIPNPHNGQLNTHRFCLNDVDRKGEIFDLTVNKNDIDWFRKLFDKMFPTQEHL